MLPWVIHGHFLKGIEYIKYEHNNLLSGGNVYDENY